MVHAILRPFWAFIDEVLTTGKWNEYIYGTNFMAHAHDPTDDHMMYKDILHILVNMYVVMGTHTKYNFLIFNFVNFMVELAWSA